MKSLSFFSRTNAAPRIWSRAHGNIGMPARSHRNVHYLINRLENGINVASVDSPGTIQAAGLLVRMPLCAAVPVTPEFSASAYVLEKLAFKATKNISETSMQERLDKIIGTVQSKAYRESMFLSGTVMPGHVEDLISLFTEIIANPLVTDAELSEMEAVANYEITELYNKPELLLPELLHGPAFYSNQDSQKPGYPNFNSILSIPAALKTMKPQDIMDFAKAICRGSNIYILGAGVAHSELLGLSQKYVGGLVQPSTNDQKIMNKVPNVNNLQYVGGEHYIEKEDLPLVHLAIGFKGPQASDPDSFTTAVLQMLMGGGGSFSAGGPGKGMYSRLYTQVLNRYHWIESARVFSHVYSNTGMFGIHGSALPTHGRELCYVLIEQLNGMGNSLTDAELNRAKRQVQSAVLMGIESRMTEMEDLADQVSTTNGKYITPKEICERIEAVNKEDINRVVQNMIQTNLSVAAYGPLSRIPSYAQICAIHGHA